MISNDICRYSYAGSAHSNNDRMTEELIKEQLSRHFLQLIANRGGYKCTRPTEDNGVDLIVSRVSVLHFNGVTRMMDSGQYIDLQLKCTCDASVIPTASGFKYDLEAKNYNDMIWRRAAPAAPLVLALLVLPDDDATWLQVEPDRLIAQRSAYWYTPPQDAPPTTNAAKKRIEVPSGNRIDMNFFGGLFGSHYG